MKLSRFSLTFAIISSLALLLVLTWLLLSLISFKTAEKDLLAQKNEYGRLLLSSFAGLVPPQLSAGQGFATADSFARKLAAERDFAGLTVVDREGRVLYAVADKRGGDERLDLTLQKGEEGYAFSDGGLYLSRYAPIVAGGKPVGAARLTLSLAGEMERLQRSRRMFLAYFALDFLLLLGFGSALMSRFIVLPIKRLLSATERITAGDYGQKVHVPGSVEIGELAASFNRMVEALRREREEVARSISSLEAANRELQSAREESLRSEKMASVGLLAAGMAHEIGTPLAAILGYAGILRDEIANDPEKTDYLRRIESDCGRIDRIVRGLLDYARPAEARYELLDPEELLRDTLELAEGQGALKKIQASLTAEEGLPRLYADRHQLQQVLMNLVINARDAMPQGGALFVHAAREGSECVTIRVRDTGEGIAPENLARIFDPFFTTKEPGRGTGLGLAISARIVDSLGGTITAESEKGGGTVFTIRLPVVEGGDRGPVAAEKTVKC